MDISHWDAAIHYGIQLAQYCDQTLSGSRYFTEIVPSVLPCPKTQEHQSTCVDSWVHRNTRKWTSAIGTRQFTMAFSLPNIVIKPDRVNAISRRSPSVLPCPKTQEHQSTCVDSWVHRVPENGHQPLGRGNSLWRCSLPNIVIKPDRVTLFHGDCPHCVLPCPKTQEHQSTCVDSWVHRVTENGHQPLGRGNSLWHSACPILWSNPISVTLFHGDCPLCAPLP